MTFRSDTSHLNDNEGVIDNSKPSDINGLTKNLKLYITYNSITVYYYIYNSITVYSYNLQKVVELA